MVHKCSIESSGSVHSLSQAADQCEPPPILGWLKPVQRTAAHIAHTTHAGLSQHSIGSDSPVHSLVILGCLGQVVTGLSLSHPWRPRGSQSGREKGWDESFQVRVKEPLGTDSHQAISKNSSGCRLLIGHKKCFVLLCPIGKQFLLSFFREFVHDGCCLHRACLAHAPKNARSQETFSLI